MGGKSREHEVSFNSGRTVCDHLDSSRYEIIPIFQTVQGELYLLPWRFLHRGKTTDFTHRLAAEAELITWDALKQIIDFVFPAMHGQYAEDGTLQGFLELLGIPYLGSKVLASALGMNKKIQKTILRAHAIDVPRSIELDPNEIDNAGTNPDLFNQLLGRLSRAHLFFPLVIKPACEGSSLGVSIVHTENELLPALQYACKIDSAPQTVLIEEKINGMEFSCVCLTDYQSGKLFALTPTEVVPEEGIELFCYAQKYMPGRASKYTPARCSSQNIRLIQDTCVRATKALGMENFSRIDGFLTQDNRVIIVDPNSLSGMGPSSFLFREAIESDMNHTQVINHLIETELHAYGMLTSILKQEKEEINMPTPKLRVAVLLGGRSNEREISLESGRNIIYKLSRQKYAILPLFLSEQLELFPLTESQLIRNSTHEIAATLNQGHQLAWQALSTQVDFVFIALHGGEGENGCIQGALEMLNLPYNGSSVLTSALCMDKYKTNQFLHAQGFETPKGYLLSKEEFETHQKNAIENIIEKISLPVIIKPHNDGCSFMVHKADTKITLMEILKLFFAQNKSHALIEECIIGMELTIGCIGNSIPQALPPSLAVSASSILSIEEKFLPGAGENQTPAPLPPESLLFVQNEIERIYSALNCKGYARIDCFYQDATISPTGHERIICIEVNTLPGMTPATVLFHQAAEIGIKPSEFIDKIIAMGLELHGKAAINNALASQTYQLSTIQK
jgi:D-alanine-D-alanine ligase